MITFRVFSKQLEEAKGDDHLGAKRHLSSFVDTRGRASAVQALTTVLDQGTH